MSVLEVYDPPMCCSTGVCGPDVDPKLAQFAGDLDWLKGQGIEVRRFNLAQEPVRFVEMSAVKRSWTVPGATSCRPLFSMRSWRWLGAIRHGTSSPGSSA